MKEIGEADGGKVVTMATCCVTGKKGDHNQVTAAHLLPRSAPPRFLEKLDMDLKRGFDSFRNVILLAKNIKEAFDAQCLCFVSEENTGEFELKILDEKVGDEPIWNGSTIKIKTFSGKTMKYADKNRPYSRVLSYHERTSYIKAINEG